MTDKFGNFEFIFIILNSSSSDAFKLNFSITLFLIQKSFFHLNQNMFSMMLCQNIELKPRIRDF
jgi:hypothetical protein